MMDKSQLPLKRSEIPHAHDRVFQAIMSDMRVAKDMLAHHLPPEVKEKINLDTLKLEHGSFIDPELKTLHTDILYSVALTHSSDNTGYIYTHIEHQSEADEIMAFRMIKYAVKIIDRHLKNHKTTTLPVIVPVVIYNGKNVYSYSLNVFDLFGQNKSFAEKFMFKAFHLVDLNTISDEEIRQHEWSCLLEILLKHIHARDIMGLLDQISEEFQRIIGLNADDYVMAMVKYVLEKAEIQDRQRFLSWVKKNLPPKLETQAMTLAEQWKSEGIQIGMQQGTLEGERTLLKRQLTKRFGQIPSEDLKKIEDADSSDLLEWADKIIEAKTLKELFEKYH